MPFPVFLMPYFQFQNQCNGPSCDLNFDTVFDTFRLQPQCFKSSFIVSCSITNDCWWFVSSCRTNGIKLLVCFQTIDAVFDTNHFLHTTIFEVCTHDFNHQAFSFAFDCLFQDLRCLLFFWTKTLLVTFTSLDSGLRHWALLIHATLVAHDRLFSIQQPCDENPGCRESRIRRMATLHSASKTQTKSEIFWLTVKKKWTNRDCLVFTRLKSANRYISEIKLMLQFPCSKLKQCQIKRYISDRQKSRR